MRLYVCYTRDTNRRKKVVKVNQPITGEPIKLLPQYTMDDLVLALGQITPNDGEDDPLRCTRWGPSPHGDTCPNRADNEDGSCSPCRMMGPREGEGEILDIPALAARILREL